MSLTLTELVDAELRRRGDSLPAWSARHGLATASVAAMLEGLDAPHDELFGELSDALGVSPTTLTQMRAA